MIIAPNIHALNLGPLTYLTPKAVEILTQPLTFDEFVGASMNVKQGVFGQDSVIVRFEGEMPKPQDYEEGNNYIPKSNTTEKSITVGVYYNELGWEVDLKALAGSELQNFDIITDKTSAVMNALAIDRNNINFLGRDKTSGGLPVYGILNYPGLSDYITLPAGEAGSTKWADKTADEIYNDIAFMINTLGIQTDGLSYSGFNRGNEYRIGVSMKVYGYLTKTNSYGLLVMDKVRQAFDNKVKMIDYEDGTNTAYGSYIELARFYPIHQVGHTLSQDIASAVTGAIVNRPVMIAQFKGL